MRSAFVICSALLLGVWIGWNLGFDMHAGDGLFIPLRSEGFISHAASDEVHRASALVVLGFVGTFAAASALVVLIFKKWG